MPGDYAVIIQLVRSGRDAGPYRFFGALPVQEVKTFAHSYEANGNRSTVDISV